MFDIAGDLGAEFVEGSEFFFVAEFFDGSAANLVMSLLGSRRISKADIQRLKQLINEKETPSTATKGKSP